MPRTGGQNDESPWEARADAGEGDGATRFARLQHHLGDGAAGKPPRLGRLGGRRHPDDPADRRHLPFVLGHRRLDQLLENYPPALLSLFGIEAGVDFTTAIGYLETEVFSFMVPLLLIGFGVAAGARLVAGDEERGTLGLTLARPVTRTRLVLARALALALMCLAMGALVFLLLLASGVVFELRVPVDQLLAATAGQTLLAVLFGTVALTVGCALGRRGAAAAAGAGAAVLAYLWNGLTPLVEGLSDLTRLSPFEWATGQHPLRTGFDGPGLALLALAAVLVLGAGVLTFNRRDVAG
jgi:ABC-2 type transport system permease protein